MEAQTLKQSKQPMGKKDPPSRKYTKRSWYRRLFRSSKRCSPLVYCLLLVTICSGLCLIGQVCADDVSSPAAAAGQLRSQSEESRKLQANHRSELEEEEAQVQDLPESLAGKQSSDLLNSANLARRARQYEAALGASGSGSYVSLASDGAAYLSGGATGGPSSYGAASGPASHYSNDLSAGYHPASSYHDSSLPMGRGYPLPSPVGPMLHQHHHHPGFAGATGLYGPPPAPASLFSSGSVFPLIAKGFDVSEVVCTAIAVAIGAVIVGAPFILIYLFIMNQVNGNAANGMGPSGGSISLTGPTASTTVNGRKKRHTSIPEALFKQLSPLVNSDQLAQTFKALMSAMSKYQV